MEGATVVMEQIGLMRMKSSIMNLPDQMKYAQTAECPKCGCKTLHFILNWDDKPSKFQCIDATCQHQWDY